MRETIFLAVCNALGVDYKEAASRSRYRENVVARQMYFTLVREIYGYRYSLGRIGRMKYFEKEVHHSTILYHLQKFKDEINQPFMADIKPIYEELLKQFKTKN
jgi:chromosomal replication initiation ATPase DnaA